MKIINHTNLDVKPIVKWLTKGITRRIALIIVSYTRKHGSSGHVDYRMFTSVIKVAVAKDGYPYPMNYWRSAHFNFPKYEVNNPIENLVAVLAHELCHLRKHQSLKGRTPAQASGIDMNNDWHLLVKEATKNMAEMEIVLKNANQNPTEEQTMVVMAK